MQIWKYALGIEPHQLIKMPKGARPLCVQVQNGVPTLWAFVDTDGDQVQHTVYMLGTGAGEMEDVDNYKHLGTVQLDGLVWHYFWGG